MKRYPHIISKLLYEPLVLTQQKYFAICKVMESHLAGEQPIPVRDQAPETIGEGEMEFDLYGQTAIIPVHGILGKHVDSLEMMSGGCDLDDVENMLTVAEADENIKRVIFDFRSPGGEVTGIPEMADRIASVSGKETVAFTDSECCSGALWLAASCDAFYSTSSAQVGSIGVWCAYLDVSRQMQLEGQNMQAISAGKYKLMGAYWRPLADDEKKILQDSVDKIHSQFKAAINLNRAVDGKNMEGQIFDGEEAATAGLTDGIVDNMESIFDKPIGSLA